MNRHSIRSWKVLIGILASIVAIALTTNAAVAADDRADLTKEPQAALNNLYAKVDGAKVLGAKALAILVFPKITKAGLGIGGQSGEGALFKAGKAVAFYRTSGASVGLQIGGQIYGYAMFFMNQKALDALDNANGFEVGAGPTVVSMDEGKAKTATSTTAKDDIYAFIFSQQGLMAGIEIQGNKITKLDDK
jgi:lipid-binding SYLF domain-containing protein